MGEGQPIRIPTSGSLPHADKKDPGPKIFVCQFDLELLTSMSNILGFHSREFFQMGKSICYEEHTAL